MCGTPEYIAPEVILCKGHNKSVDYWSFGVLLFEMLIGHPPFYGDNNFTVFEKILATQVVYPPDLDADARDLIARLLVADPEQRLGGRGGPEELQRHKFFHGMDWAKLYAKQIPSPMRLFAAALPPPPIFKDF